MVRPLKKNAASIVDESEWEVSLHHLQGGLDKGTTHLSLRSVNCNFQSSPILQVKNELINLLQAMIC